MSMIAVCAFFNPFNSPIRQRAFRRFRFNLERSGIPVLCVEQQFPEVSTVSCSTDICVTGGDLLWQKECLLQMGIDRAVGEGYEQILICDADILFETPHSIELIKESFYKFDYFQPYEAITMEYADGEIVRPSAMSVDSPHTFGIGHPGSCWAASSSFLRTVRLYPYAILGGGDVVMTHLCAAAIRHGSSSRRFCDLCIYFTKNILFRNLTNSILEWALQIDKKSFRLGHTAGILLRSLDHGPRSHRLYHERYSSWQGDHAVNGPRPKIDFEVCATGLLHWINPREEWTKLINDYFCRRENKS